MARLAILRSTQSNGCLEFYSSATGVEVPDCRSINLRIRSWRRVRKVVFLRGSYRRGDGKMAASQAASSAVSS